MGTGSFPGLKRPEHRVKHEFLPSSTEIKERVELYLCFSYVPSWNIIGRNLTFINE